MGRPSKLTTERTAQIVEAILAGAPLAVAASHGGIHEATLHRYQARGQAALEAADYDEEATPDDDRPYCEFYQSIEKARRDWELRQIALIQRAAQGHAYTKTVTKTEERVDKTGMPFTLTTSTVEEGTNHAWQAAAWLLERRYPQIYGRVYRAEITGPEGAPIELNLDRLEQEALAKVDELTARRDRKAG